MRTPAATWCCRCAARAARWSRWCCGCAAASSRCFDRAARPGRRRLPAAGRRDDAGSMAVQLNHTIVHVRDRRESATFLAEILGLPEPTPYGPFLVVEAANGVSLDFIEEPGE